jgi:hypothetical protein
MVGPQAASAARLAVARAARRSCGGAGSFEAHKDWPSSRAIGRRNADLVRDKNAFKEHWMSSLDRWFEQDADAPDAGFRSEWSWPVESAPCIG